MTSFSDGLEELTTKILALTFNVTSITDLFSTTVYYSPLLKPEDPAKAAIDIDKRERTFSCQNPVFLRKIDFFGVNTKNLELTVFTSEGVARKIAIYEYASGSFALVHEFCVKFTLRSKGTFAKPKLSGIKIFGFDFKHQQKMRTALTEFVSVNYELTGFLADAKKTVAAQELRNSNAVAVLAETQESLSATEGELVEVADILAAKNKELLDAEARLKAAEVIAASMNSEIEAKRNNIQQLERESKKLNIDVADLNQELSSLVNDRSVISDEYSDFVKEGKGQAAIYIKLMALPVLVMAGSVAVLFNGANDLIVGHYETSQDIMASILLRVPFAAAVGGAIYYSWIIGSSFMKKIFEIQEERLTLAKLLVLAKNTVFSTAEDLGVDAKEKFHLRTRLKIEMLKSHLAKNLGGGITLSELDPKQKEPKRTSEETPSHAAKPVVSEPEEA
ncbi:hypothetical protein [Pseudomonas sp. Z18(2022)]|uniref:hypothetical protein n=1 Tax=Pseudomonas sp. Z18(2022) TaxID=2983410 RepID=UPI002E801D6A|nr:hypothetical protein [Pseudomonas sp. Z18(2022)]